MPAALSQLARRGRDGARGESSDCGLMSGRHNPPGQWAAFRRRVAVVATAAAVISMVALALVALVGGGGGRGGIAAFNGVSAKPDSSS